MLGLHRRRSRAAAPPQGEVAEARALPTATQSPPQPSLLPWRLSCGGFVAVHGEAHYQPALRAAASGQTCWDHDNPIRVQAVLVPEPTNPFDSNAVRVDVLGQAVGYLPADIVADYQAVLSALATRGKYGWCEGRILGGGEHYYGIHLALDRAHLLCPINEAEDLEIISSERTAFATKRSKDPALFEELAKASAVPGMMFPVWAELGVEAAPSGKSAGAPQIHASIGGKRLGALTPAASDSAVSVVLALAAAGKRPGTIAVLAFDEEWSLGVRLPARSGQT